jgi:hypothetical protein
MSTEINVVLFGSLRGGGGPAALRDAPLPLALSEPAPLPEILGRLGIPPERVQVAMVNHRSVEKAALVRPSDRLALFPPEYPFFVDWKDLR